MQCCTVHNVGDGGGVFLNPNGENNWGERTLLEPSLLLLVFWSECFVVIGLQVCKRSMWTCRLIMIILPSRATFTDRVKSGPEQHKQTLIQCTLIDEWRVLIWGLILKHCWALFRLVSDQVPVTLSLSLSLTISICEGPQWLLGQSEVRF